MSRRRMQSREGTPLGSARNCWSQSRRFAAQRWMAVGPSQPHNIPHTTITITSTKRCLRFRVCRGSESDSKYDPIDSTLTHLVAIQRILPRGGRTRRAILDRATMRTPPQDKVYHIATHRASPRRLPIYARWPWGLGLTQTGRQNCLYAGSNPASSLPWSPLSRCPDGSAVGEALIDVPCV